MIQYAHVQGNITNGTVAVEVPPKQLMEQLILSHSNKILLNVGISVKSGKDQYNRKTGRETSLKRIAPSVLTFDRMIQNDLAHNYIFYSDDLEINFRRYNLVITLNSIKESDKVYLIKAYLEEIRDQN